MYMSSNAIDVKVTGAVGTIVLNRPERRNALTRAMLAQLAEALGDLHLEKRVRAIVLTGAGTRVLRRHGPARNARRRHAARRTRKHQDWGDTAEAYRELVTQMIELPKPIIASVNGPAVAGGAGLVLASDIVVASAGGPIRPARAAPRHRGRRRRAAPGVSRRRRHGRAAAAHVVALSRPTKRTASASTTS